MTAHSDATSIEAVQRYWNRRPCNLRHSLAEFGSKQYFEEVDARRYLVEPHILTFADFQSWGNRRVLEIGCGIGTDMIRFLDAGARYVGTELSEESLKIAEKRLHVYGRAADLIQSDCENLDLPPSLFRKDFGFDLIYSFGVLHHTPNIAKALRSIRGYAAEQTEFRFMVYAKNSWKAAMITAGLDQPEAQAGCPIANTYYPEEIIDLLQSNGWRCLSIYQDHIFPWNLEKYLQYEYEYEPYFAAMPREVLAAFTAALGWHLLVQAKPSD